MTQRNCAEYWTNEARTRWNKWNNKKTSRSHDHGEDQEKVKQGVLGPQKIHDQEDLMVDAIKMVSMITVPALNLTSETRPLEIIRFIRELDKYRRCGKVFHE